MTVQCGMSRTAPLVSRLRNCGIFSSDRIGTPIIILPCRTSCPMGQKPDVFACGFCHRADGAGGPENARLAGLTPAYFVQQMEDFKNGARVTSVPKRNIGYMVKLSKSITEEEIASTAVYFSDLRAKKTIDVIETEMVPKTNVYDWHLVAVDGGDKEPIGNRIIEVPKNPDQFASVTPEPSLQPMSRLGVSLKVSRWSQPVAGARPPSAEFVTGVISVGSARYLASPVARQATSSGNFTTSSTETVLGHGAL